LWLGLVSTSHPWRSEPPQNRLAVAKLLARPLFALPGATRSRSRPAQGLWRTLSNILGKTCDSRELTTASMLALSLLLRTFGSVWVARHWGRIVKSLVTRQFGEMRRLVAQFGLYTISLAVLNALLKYYIATLRDQVREKITKWCHDQYLRKNDMIFYKANKVRARARARGRAGDVGRRR
jgi:ABC-type uncharacterized transport system fused permease/ATPase subunit